MDIEIRKVLIDLIKSVTKLVDVATKKIEEEKQ